MTRGEQVLAQLVLAELRAGRLTIQGDRFIRKQLHSFRPPDCFQASDSCASVSCKRSIRGLDAIRRQRDRCADFRGGEKLHRLARRAHLERADLIQRHSRRVRQRAPVISDPAWSERSVATARDSPAT